MGASSNDQFIRADSAVCKSGKEVLRGLGNFGAVLGISLHLRVGMGTAPVDLKLETDYAYVGVGCMPHSMAKSLLTFAYDAPIR